MQLIINDKVIQLDEKDARMIEDGLYRNIVIRRLERGKNHCKDGDNLNELGMKIYQEELVIDHLRNRIIEALGGA